MIRTIRPLLLVLLIPVAGCLQPEGDPPSHPDEPQHATHSEHAAHSEHADLADREIGALSDEEIAGLLEGAGMGYALAAELNAYPGPRHVLDLERELSLTEEQVEAIARIFDEMNERARELGSRLVAAERELDALFRNRSATDGALRELVSAIGALDGEVRYVHLEAHLRTTELLNHDQIMRYQMERGYAHDHSPHGAH